MMKNFLFLMIFATAFCSAQVQRFIYDYKFVRDTANREKVTDELMYLDIDKKGSRYYSENTRYIDSLMHAAMEKPGGFANLKSAAAGKNLKGSIRNKVTKVYPSFTTYLHTNLSSDRYKVEETQKPIWKILPEKETVGTYTAQKATTNYLGRNWTAWFTTDLPFQDGPYKFSGLPGLNVKIEDDRKSHVITITAAKTLPGSIEEMLKGSDAPDEISVDNLKFNKLWREYVKDPNKVTRQSIASAGTDASGNSNYTIMDGSGKKLDPNEYLRKQEVMFKNNLKKDNNQLDSTLFQY